MRMVKGVLVENITPGMWVEHSLTINGAFFPGGRVMSVDPSTAHYITLRLVTAHRHDEPVEIHPSFQRGTYLICSTTDPRSAVALYLAREIPLEMLGLRAQALLAKIRGRKDRRARV